MNLKLAKYNILILFAASLLVSCTVKNPNDIRYVNKPAPYYNPNSQPVRSPYNSNYQSPKYQAPNQQHSQQQYQAPQGQQYQQYQQPQPQTYYPQQPRYPVANSRYYSNPYEVIPQNPYLSYDSDQYYVAPTYYGTTEINSPDGGFEKF